jgi:hypothetical protein
MFFQREKADPVLFSELKPLLEEHWEEIAHYKDIPLEPDWDMYARLEDSGNMRVYTARIDDGGIDHGKLVGYAVFFIKNNIHYKSSKQASQDILFISKNRRGLGGRFILWCDEQLKNDGVQAVYHHVKQAHNFGPLLERFGYQLVDLIYARRLD